MYAYKGYADHIAIGGSTSYLAQAWILTQRAANELLHFN